MECHDIIARLQTREQIFAECIARCGNIRTCRHNMQAHTDILNAVILIRVPDAVFISVIPDIAAQKGNRR